MYAAASHASHVAFLFGSLFELYQSIARWRFLMFAWLVVVEVGATRASQTARPSHCRSLATVSMLTEWCNLGTFVTAATENPAFLPLTTSDVLVFAGAQITIRPRAKPRPPGCLNYTAGYK